MTAPADTPPAYARLVAALSKPDYLFDREQVAFLMSLSSRWAREAVEGEASPDSYAAGHADGYRTRCTEENAAYPPEPIHIAGRWIDQTNYRRTCDAAAREAREDDYPGGPVGTWGPDRCDDPGPHTRHRVPADDDAGHGWFTCPGVDVPASAPYSGGEA